MKKIILELIAVMLIAILVGCGAKKCFTCGESLDDGSFTAFGNDYCSHCFMYDLGLDSTETTASDTTDESSSDTKIPSNSKPTSAETSKPTTSSKPTNTTSIESSKPSKSTHTHSFASATCTQPKKCSCGETKGEALGHKWTKATCTEPKTCKSCSATEGNALGHNFENGTCKVCQAIDSNYIQYTVSYNANGGWGETESSNHIYDASRALSKNSFKRAGYKFIGWNTNRNATSAQYTDTQNVKNLTKTNGDKITLYAVWKESQTSQFDYCKRAISGKKEVNYHASSTDNFGVTHNDVAVFMNRDSYPVEKRYDERYTNGLFSKIKGVLYLGGDYTLNQYTNIKLVIKADGKIVYESKFFTKYSGPQSFEVNISGANLVEISVVDPVSNHIEAWNRGGDIIIENLLLIR